MPKNPPHQTRQELIEEVCWHYVIHGNQQAVAKELNLDQTAVSRCLAKARDEELLLVNPRFGPNFPRERLAELNAKFGDTLKLDLKLRSLGAVPHFKSKLGGTRSSEAGEFVRDAARTLNFLMNDGPDAVEYSAVSWGFLLRNVIGELQKSGTRRPEKSRPLHCIPISGEPVFLLNGGWQQMSASLLAQKIESALNEVPPRDTPSLLGVPAFISRHLAPGFRGFVENIPGYKKIFGRSGEPPSAESTTEGEPWINRVTALITGIGSTISSPKFPDSIGTFADERCQQLSIPAEKVREAAHGDLAGVLLWKKANDKSVIEWNEDLVGLKEDHLRDIAKRKPGVIVIARGSEKAEVVFRAIVRGYVSVLIADQELVTAIEISMKSL